MLGPEGKKTEFARFGEGDAPRTLAFVPVTPETRRAGIAGDLLVVTVSRGAWPVNEVVRISGPFERFVQDGAAAPRRRSSSALSAVLPKPSRNSQSMMAPPSSEESRAGGSRSRRRLRRLARAPSVSPRHVHPRPVSARAPAADRGGTTPAAGATGLGTTSRAPGAIVALARREARPPRGQRGEASARAAMARVHGRGERGDLRGVGAGCPREWKRRSRSPSRRPRPARSAAPGCHHEHAGAPGSHVRPPRASLARCPRSWPSRAGERADLRSEIVEEIGHVAMARDGGGDSARMTSVRGPRLCVGPGACEAAGSRRGDARRRPTARAAVPSASV